MDSIFAAKYHKIYTEANLDRDSLFYTLKSFGIYDLQALLFLHQFYSYLRGVMSREFASANSASQVISNMEENGFETLNDHYFAHIVQDLKTIENISGVSKHRVVFGMYIVTEILMDLLPFNDEVEEKYKIINIIIDKIVNAQIYN
jgi:hypothetical protein